MIKRGSVSGASFGVSVVVQKDWVDDHVCTMAHTTKAEGFLVLTLAESGAKKIYPIASIISFELE